LDILTRLNVYKQRDALEYISGISQAAAKLCRGSRRRVGRVATDRVYTAQSAAGLFDISFEMCIMTI